MTTLGDVNGDNCTLLSNPTQLDSDNDGFGNRCDPDLNNDGIVNFIDYGIWVSLYKTAGSADADFNGDGNINFFDFEHIGRIFLERTGSEWARYR